MLCEVLSEFSQPVLPLPCNVSVNLTSGRRHGDSITVSLNYWTYKLLSLYNI